MPSGAATVATVPGDAAGERCWKVEDVVCAGEAADPASGGGDAVKRRQPLVLGSLGIVQPK